MLVKYAFQYYVGTKEGEVIHLADAYTEKYWILIMIKIFQLLPIMKTWFILRRGRNRFDLQDTER